MAMSWYRRWYVPGGTYFFTVVTHCRRPIFTSDSARVHLRSVLEAEQAKRPFKIAAMVLLPDHLHTIWTLPEADADYSRRWASIKEAFTRRFLTVGGDEAPISNARYLRRERGIWQRRFWEHLVRDEDDLICCADYIHWNPVKHGLVTRVKDYPWSSFHRFVEAGDYDPDWGSGDAIDVPGAEWE
jgi:putative transposase